MGNSSAKPKPQSEVIKPVEILKETVEEDIIVKCAVEEMVKSFFQDYLIVWHDPNINSQENQKYITQLKGLCQVSTFTEWEKAKDFLRQSKAACQVITSGTNGEFLVKEISSDQNVSNIYIFCQNKEYHSLWAKSYQKVSCIESNIQNLINQIQQNLLEWYKQASSLKLNLPAFAPIFDDTDKSQMNHLHRYLKVIPQFKNRLQAKKDFINLSKAIYTDPNNSRIIADFEKYYNEYNKDHTLRWYTFESFLYKVTNNCLRIATSDSIQYCRLLLKDIEQAIKDQYQAKSKNYNGLLYRGAYLSQEEWLSLKENQDKEIEMHGFLSVSKEKHVALNFIKSDPSKKVLITIIVPKGPNEEEQGFAEIEEYSQFPQEREILFNVRSRFTVLETEEEYSQDLPCRHLVLLYGAQGFRRFISEKNPVIEISTQSNENISCVNCNGTSEAFLFRHIEKQIYYCKNCLDFTDASPLLYIPINTTPPEVKIKGCLLTNSCPQQTPFYGCKCSKCSTKKQKRYFLCTDCQKKWCENCFPETLPCIQANHALIFEKIPFTFWCEKMSEAELSHLTLQDNFIKEYGSIFQQAEMYFESHKYDKAIEFYTLYIHQNGANPKNIKDLAASYHNLASVFSYKVEYKKAQEYHSKALELYKSMYGENHTSIAHCYTNIGSLHYNQRDYKTALEYFTKALDIRKSVYGENHLDIAASYRSIGSVYYAQNEFPKALEFYTKVLDIRNLLNGENHPEVANSYVNIGNIYCNQGEYNKALEYFLKSLDISKSVYGENHRDVATCYNNIGTINYYQEEFNEALENFLKALEIRKLVLPENHPTFAISFTNIANIYDIAQEYHKALEYHLRALDINKRAFGENHSSLTRIYNNIGKIYKKQGDYENALEYLTKALEIYKAISQNDPEIIKIQEVILEINQKKNQ